MREILSPPSSSHISAGSDAVILLNENDTPLLRDMENIFRKKYFTFIRKHSTSDADAARRLGLAPPNYHRMCKELGLKS